MKKLHALSLSLLSLLLYACGGIQQHKAKSMQWTTTPVHTVTVTPVEWPTAYEAVGTVRARTSAVLSSKVIGYVREVNFQIGDRVHAGQILVTLDSRDFDAQYRSAEAALEEVTTARIEADNAVTAAKAGRDLAEVTFGRMKDLFGKRSISNQEFDEAFAKFKAAQAAYEMALSKRRQLESKIAQAKEGVKAAEVLKSYAQISAPFTGRVTEKHVEPGNLATPGAPLATVEREGSYRLEASVGESKVPLVRTGDHVSVVLEALNKTVSASVSELVPAVDSVSRTYIVKVDLPPLEDLRSGMFGRAVFHLGTRKVLAVPSGAIVEHGQLHFVLVAEDEVAKGRLVTLGEMYQGQREVLSGLSGGEKVIFPIPSGLAEGTRVEVLP
jgi:RND family efflux transporter MFP subunit